MDPVLLVAVAIVGVVASFIGATVGGVGLITIPSLMFLGFSAKSAIATHIFGSLGMTGCFYKFHQSRKIDYGVGIPITIAACVGAYLGAKALLEVSEEILVKLLGIVLLVLLFMIVLDRKGRGVKKRQKPGKERELLGYLAFMVVGFWRAFVSAGFAIFSTYVLVLMYRKTFLQSAGTKLLVLFVTGLITLAIYSGNGLVQWVPGLVLMLGMLVGSYAGASYGLKKGDEWVKKVFIVIVLFASLGLLTG